jgi:hypothetical protein
MFILQYIALFTCTLVYSYAIHDNFLKNFRTEEDKCYDELCVFLHCLQSTAKLVSMILMVKRAQCLYDVVQFLFQLGAFRIQNLQRMHVCVPVQSTHFQPCYIFIFY